MEVLPKILIVEDDPDLLEIQSGLLSKAGYEILEATTGEEGLAIIHAKNPDLVLLDIVLPDLDGVDICKQVKSNPNLNHITIMLISGIRTDDETFSQGLASGAECVVRRPLPNNELVARVDSLMRMKQDEYLHTTILNSISDAVYLTDKDGDFTFICKNIDVIFGYTKSEIIALNNIFNLLPNLDKAILDSTKEIENIELQISSKNNISKTILLNLKPVSIENSRFLFTAHDITERKQAEEALQESEEKYRTLFEDSPIAITIVDIDGDVTDCNEKVLEISGMKRDEIVGRPFLEISSLIDDLSDPLEIFQEAIQGKNINPLKLQTRRPDGETRWIETSLAPLWKDDQVIAIQVNALDITERKNTEEELRQTLAQLSATKNALPDLLFEVNQEGIVYDFHAPNPEILFTGPEQFLGQSLHNFLPSEASQIIQHALNEAAETGHHKGAIYELPLPDGTRWFELSIAKKEVPNQPQDHFVALARDITNRVQAQEEQQRLIEQVIQDSNDLEKRVQERTEQYQTIIDLTADREIRMAELKDVIRKLRKQLSDAGLEPIANDPVAMDED